MPKRLAEKLTYFQTRLAPLAAHAAQIGLTPGQVDELQAKVDAARAAQRAQGAAIAAARAATASYNNAIDALGAYGASLIHNIDAMAEASGNPEVYALATIDPPAKGSPTPAPGKPHSCKTELDGDGSLILTWSCPNPRGSKGTMYQIERQIVGGEPSFTFLDVVGKKRYVDRTIPEGATQLMYKIRATRSTARGDAAIFNVFFGSNGAKSLGSFFVNGVNQAA